MWFLNFMRFTVFTVAGLVIRKTWDWFTSDIEPEPGTKAFEIEYSTVKKRYHNLRKRKEEWNETIRKVR